MRYALSSLAFLVCMVGPASAAPLTIEQNAKTNYAVIKAGQGKASLDVSLKQSGTLNGISSTQTADQNAIGSSQKGWRNTITIYQQGWTDISSVAQSGPVGNAGSNNLPTTYSRENVEDNYLTYFTSGGFSMVTLTDPGSTITSRFGRYR